MAVFSTMSRWTVSHPSLCALIRQHKSDLYFTGLILSALWPGCYSCVCSRIMVIARPAFKWACTEVNQCNTAHWNRLFPEGRVWITYFHTLAAHGQDKQHWNCSCNEYPCHQSSLFVWLVFAAQTGAEIPPPSSVDVYHLVQSQITFSLPPSVGKTTVSVPLMWATKLLSHFI